MQVFVQHYTVVMRPGNYVGLSREGAPKKADVLLTLSVCYNFFGDVSPGGTSVRKSMTHFLYRLIYISLFLFFFHSSATQFLLTAGNCMNRHQLRSCLRDVKSLHAEFWSIPTNAPDPVEQATGSALKNRYRYVLPNPHSRVKLPCDVDDSDPGSGYINGNYIRVQLFVFKCRLKRIFELGTNDFCLRRHTTESQAFTLRRKVP